MNLYYLMAKGHKRLANSTGVARKKVRRNDRVWHGLHVESGGSIYLRGATQCHPFRSRCESPGWYVSALGGDTEVSVAFIADGKAASETRFVTTLGGFEPIIVPWPAAPTEHILDLQIGCSGGSGMFLGCYFDLDRGPLIARCKGTGLELGPGVNPLVLPADDRQIKYVEQKAPAEWSSLYGDTYKKDFDPILEPLYVTGEAHDLPAQSGSLDFIFSSHVFEHLANPLGHLRIWSGHLRNGGEVVMIIPDFIGSKDFLMDPSTMEEIRSEFAEGRFEPSPRHYEKYAQARDVSSDFARKWMETKFSVHTHYYSNDNMSRLLEFAIAQGWFEKYMLLHSRNAREFYVVLAK